jgi:hypothetical protein
MPSLTYLLGYRMSSDVVRSEITWTRGIRPDTLIETWEDLTKLVQRRKEETLTK